MEVDMNDYIERLIVEEQHYRKLALDTKSARAWNRANELLLEIMDAEKELDCSNSTNSMDV